MVLSGLMDFLTGISHDPITYSIVFFLYTVAATVVLPIPVEAGLFLSPSTPIALKALMLGARQSCRLDLGLHAGLEAGKPS